MRRITRVSGLLLLALSAATHASGFFDANQVELRADVEYLLDLHVIRIPVTTWPIPIDDLHRAVADADESNLAPSAEAALDRVKMVLDNYDTPDGDEVMAAGDWHPTRFRLNEDLPRQDGDATVTGGRDFGRATAHVQINYVTTPWDRQNFRVDGSYASVRLGNWLLAAGEIPRTWGPSQHDALSLSANARPIPALSIDRLYSDRPESWLLHWIGPWRATAFVGTLEQARNDVRSPFFGGARLTFSPLRSLEIGVARNTQFCGKGRLCNGRSILDLITGNSNSGTNGITASTDVSNDEAGFDVRWTSPFRHLPFSINAQTIGEDASGGIPFKYDAEFGIDTWWDLGNGDSLHVDYEWTNTACSYYKSKPIFGCTYHNYIYDKEGWRYKGFVLGSSFESDAEVDSVNLRWARRDGEEWQMHLNWGALNRGDIYDPYNIVAPTRRQLKRIELEYRFAFRDWGKFRAGTGLESLRTTDTNQTHTTPTLFLVWTHGLWLDRTSATDD